MKIINNLFYLSEENTNISRNILNILSRKSITQRQNKNIFGNMRSDI